jgi:hypothetical protein
VGRGSVLEEPGELMKELGGERRKGIEPWPSDERRGGRRGRWSGRGDGERGIEKVREEAEGEEVG